VRPERRAIRRRASAAPVAQQRLEPRARQVEGRQASALPGAQQRLEPRAGQVERRQASALPGAQQPGVQAQGARPPGLALRRLAERLGVSRGRRARRRRPERPQWAPWLAPLVVRPPA
jgi:hypothetical protein